MLGEVSVIIGALKAVNEGIKVLKESEDNVNNIAQFFGKHTEAKESVAIIEKEQATGVRRLSREEALDLAWAKKALREQEKEFKKSIPRDVWNDMLHIQSQSIADEKHAKMMAKVNERKRIAKLKSNIIEGLSVVVGLGIIGGIVYYFYFM